MAVQLTEGWWKTAWPSSTPPKSYDKMKKTIKATKAAKRGLSAINYVVLLDEILEVIGDLEKEAAAQFKSAPLDKRKAKSILADFRKFIEKEKSGVSLDAKKIVVFKKPFGNALAEKVGDKPMGKLIGRMDIELELMSWLVNELRDKNAEGMLNTAIQKEFDTSLATAARIYKSYTSDGPMTKAQRETLTSLLGGIQKELSETIRKIPAEILRKIGINAKTAREYKIDKGVSIAAGTIGTGLSAAGIGLPGTPALAIAMTLRSAASLASDIQGLRATIESKITRFNTYLVALKTMFMDAERGRDKMSTSENVGELTVSTMNSLLGIDVLPTMKKAKADLKDIEGKLALMAVKSQAFQKDVLDAIEATDKLEKKLNDAVGPDKIMKYTKKLKGARDDLTDALNQAYEIARRLNNADGKVVEIRRKFKGMNDPSLTLRKAQKGIDIIVQLAGAAGGLGDTAMMPDPSKAKKVAGALVATAGVFTEVGTSIKKLA